MGPNQTVSEYDVQNIAVGLSDFCKKCYRDSQTEKPDKSGKLFLPYFGSV